MASEMKKSINFLIILSFLLVAFATSALAYDIAVIDENGNEYYHNNYSLFLPSHISPENVKFITAEDASVTYVDADGNETTLVNGQTIDVSPFISAYFSEPVYILNLNIDGSFKYLFLRFASSLSNVYLEIEQDVDGFLRYNLSDESASATFYNKDGTIEFKDQNGMCELKVRGNATKDYLKKPFQIKLPMRADLYSMGSSKTWLLLANYDDQSLIRNNVMYKIGEALGIKTCDFRSVDVFINGQYYGIYLLCEKVEIGKNRLEIADLEDKNDELNSSYNDYSTSIDSGILIDTTNLSQYSYIEGVVSPSDITGGYLVELDNNYYSNELCYFTTDYGNHYVIKSPEYASKSEVEYIATLMAEMEEAIMSSDGYNSNGKHYSEYIDIDSFVSAYILQELGRNYDAGSSSLYFYKDADKNGEVSKIYKGPLWDCDNTLGNIHKNGASNTDGYWAANRSIWSGLTKKTDFMLLVSEKYASVYDFIFDMIDYGGYIDSEVSLIGDSIYMEQKVYNTNNYEKWPLYYDGTHYDKWQSSQVFNFIKIYSQGNNADESTVIGYLCEHIEKRANWLVGAWGAEVTIRQRRTEPLPEPPLDEILPDEPVDSSTDTETSSQTSTDTVVDTNTNTETNIEINTETNTEINTSTATTQTDTSQEIVPQKKNFFEALWWMIKDFFKKLFSIFE